MERSDPANASLGGFEIIDSAKNTLDIVSPGTVSYADILALATRDAVVMTGKPDIQVATGKRDGMASEVTNVRPNMVDTSFTVDDMIFFPQKGLPLEDLVMLLGFYAYECTLDDGKRLSGNLESFGITCTRTIWSAHCTIFNDIFRTDSRGNVAFVNSSLDKDYAAKLAKKCATSTSTTVYIDHQTSFTFGNQYYNHFLAHRGLLQSDSNFFYEAWSESCLKLSSIGVMTDEGEIRQICSRTNV
ncbi:LOW QUALITY PROTEIN: hypothetical protein Cgig2_025319 [Carnegiea gigantea]|uniref:peroxidase n=1 Tax=Carnegiea gigantea TaxID=171969 RepID=A0A9Q1JZV7_9CARY|nr:LOW QUALITY PROTEIN: hypothetical protein Cgig2_025319 [Carnegiea gigantea]